jgi:hypothetical protein
MVILSAFFVITQLVTESSRLPTYLQTVRLPFGHPIAIAVCVWVGVDFIRRIRRGTPLDAETNEPTFGDAFEAATDRPAVPEPSLAIDIAAPAPAEDPVPVKEPELFPDVVPVEDLEPLLVAVPADLEPLPVVVPADVA